MSPFITNMAISETIRSRSGVKSYSYPVKEGQRYINLNPGNLFVLIFVQQPTKKRKGSRGLNYYASAYNKGRQLLHHKTKLNQILWKHACTRN